MNRGPGELARKRTFGWFLLFLVSFMNTIPLFALSILANLSALAGYVGFLNNWQNQSHATFVIISGVLPPAVSAIFGFFLPIVMRYLSKYQGAMTHSRLDRAVVARYFTFLVISQLVIFTLIGVVFSKHIQLPPVADTEKESSVSQSPSSRLSLRLASTSLSRTSSPRITSKGSPQLSTRHISSSPPTGSPSFLSAASSSSSISPR